MTPPLFPILTRVVTNSLQMRGENKDTKQHTYPAAFHSYQLDFLSPLDKEVSRALLSSVYIDRELAASRPIPIISCQIDKASIP